MKSSFWHAQYQVALPFLSFCDDVDTRVLFLHRLNQTWIDAVREMLPNTCRLFTNIASTLYVTKDLIQ